MMHIGLNLPGGWRQVSVKEGGFAGLARAKMEKVAAPPVHQV